MAFDYATLKTETVERMIREFGGPGYFLVDGDDTGPPYAPVQGDPTSHAANVVRISFQKADNQGTLIQENDSLFLISTEGLTIEPALEMRLQVDGVKYQIVRIDPLKPGTVNMLWKIHTRK